MIPRILIFATINIVQYSYHIFIIFYSCYFKCQWLVIFFFQVLEQTVVISQAAKDMDLCSKKCVQQTSSDASKLCEQQQSLQQKLLQEQHQSRKQAAEAVQVYSIYLPFHYIHSNFSNNKYILFIRICCSFYPELAFFFFFVVFIMHPRHPGMHIAIDS